ncbi:hypothetical protein RR48_01932 [Papilio machaon]|uniref:Uncharacterized protein n=1 Tax=Papilio machaon TaxID=76193 RepID=A0A0N0PDC7_PAPMA|nr:hypothetical protein RR48_01932 [Papilio machaon]
MSRATDRNVGDATIDMVTKELSFPSTQHQESWCAERWTGPARAGAARGD